MNFLEFLYDDEVAPEALRDEMGATTSLISTVSDVMELYISTPIPTLTGFMDLLFDESTPPSNPD